MAWAARRRVWKAWSKNCWASNGKRRVKYRPSTVFSVAMLTPLLAVGMAFPAAQATAGEIISVCVEAQPHPPYFYPDHDGSLQVLEKMAAARAGYTLELSMEPTRRCIEELRNDSADAVGAMSVSGVSLSIGAFPRKDNAVDKQKALATARTVVYRVKGSEADWNGSSFSKLTTRVLVPPGMVLLSQKLDQLGAAYDD